MYVLLLIYFVEGSFSRRVHISIVYILLTRRFVLAFCLVATHFLEDFFIRALMFFILIYYYMVEEMIP